MVGWCAIGDSVWIIHQKPRTVPSVWKDDPSRPCRYRTVGHDPWRGHLSLRPNLPYGSGRAGFGVGTSYLIVVGDLMPDAMKDFGVDFPDSTREFWVGQGLPLEARQFWIFLGFVVVVPLSCLRTLDALKFTSTAALAFVLFIVVFVLLFAIDSPRLADFDPCPPERNEPAVDCRGESGYLYTSPIRTLKVFSIFIFAFTCQQVRRFAPIVNFV